MNKLLYVLFLLSFQGFSQQVSLLDSIASKQCIRDNFYTDGLFPSQIVRSRDRKVIEDNNIFFTALINYTFQSISDSLTVQEQTMVKRIKSNSRGVYPLYQRNHSIAYNFYQVNPERPFPQLKLLSRMKKMRLADDLDDTSIIYMINNTSDSLNQALRGEINQQVTQEEKVRSTLSDYQNRGAYRTWFADKMKQDLDICVISNALLFLFQKNLDLDSTAINSISLVKDMVNSNHHFKYPQLVSSHYQNSAIILYHVARLIALADHDLLNDLRAKVVQDILIQLPKVSNQMERLILVISFYRLGDRPGFSFDFGQLNLDMSSFYWFKANPLSGSRLGVKKMIGMGDFLELKYKSEAYYLALLFELQKLSGTAWSEEDGRFLLRVQDSNK